MNQASPLIAISNSPINGGVTQTVNARELHAFLGSKRQFADWISERIQKYGFVENQDFVIFSQNCEKPKGGRPAKEFALTLDMAKELAMVERNDKGREARRYFIECEKALKQQLSQPLVLVEVVQPYVHPLAQQPMTEQTYREIMGGIADRADKAAKRVAHTMTSQLLEQCKAEFSISDFRDLSEADGRRVVEWVARYPGATIAVNGAPAALPWDRAMSMKQRVEVLSAMEMAEGAKSAGAASGLPHKLS